MKSNNHNGNNISCEQLTNQINSLAQTNLYLERQLNDFKVSPLGKIYQTYRDIASLVENVQCTLKKVFKLIKKKGLSKFLNDHLKSAKKGEVIISDEVIASPKIILDLRNEIKSITNKKLKIAWMVFGHLPKGGGHRNIYRMAYYLEKFGHEVNIYITDTNYGSIYLSERVKKDAYPIAGNIISYADEVDPCDVLIGTHWESIKYIDANRKKAKSICYFVQDYEPLFYPMGSKYLLAQETYTRGFQHICSGEWVYKKITKTHGANGGFFNFPIDFENYYDRSLPRKGKTIAFFAKPEMDRRCFEIGLYALERLGEIRSDFKVYLFGSGELNKYKYTFPHEIIYFAKSIKDLAKLYNECEIGIAFSTTNPSLVPYEMMSCGLVVIDLYTELSEYNYGGSFDAALLCQPTPETIAEKISKLMDSPEEINMRRIASKKLTSNFPSEASAARIVEDLIFKSFKST